MKHNQRSASNAQRSTFKDGWQVLMESDGAYRVRQFDLEERLLDYAALIIRIVERLPNTRVGNHISGQLLRSGTSPLSNHGEGQAAESVEDFVHKFKICLKELRESRRWLRLIKRTNLTKPDAIVDEGIRETEALIKIFFTSIRTAQSVASRRHASAVESSKLNVEC